MEYPKELHEIAFEALDMSIFLLSQNHGALIPNVLVENLSGGKTNKVFAIETTEEALIQARHYLANNANSFLRYALTWDGYVTTDSNKQDAIFVEAGEASTPDGYIIAQKYVKQGFIDKKVKCIGNAFIVEEITSLVFHL